MEIEQKDIVSKLDNLERLIKLMSTMSHMTFSQDENGGHLLIGPSPDQIEQPSQGAEQSDQTEDV